VLTDLAGGPLLDHDTITPDLKTARRAPRHADPADHEAVAPAACRLPATALVVAPQPFFAPRGTPFSVYYRTLVTAELGIAVDLLTYGQGEDVDLAGVRIVRIPDFPFLGPIRIGPSWPKLFLDGFMILWTLALLLRRRYAVVHAHEEAVFFLRWLKPLFGFKLIYDMHSSLPEQLRNYRFSSSRLLIGLFERLEATCLRTADAVITICPELARYALARMPDPGRHFLIENSIFEPVRLKAPAAGVAPAEAPALPVGRPIVLYAGTFEVYQGLELLIAAFAEARQACPEAVLVLVGGTPAQVARLRAQADDCGLGAQALILGRLPKAVVTDYTAQARVLVSPRTHGSNTPLKIYEQLASGVPLVATRILAHTQVLDDEVCFLVEPAPAAIAEGLVRALTDQADATRRAAAARARYQSAYARPVYEGKMRALFGLLGALASPAPGAAPAARRA
jgi:glycosyltransferase involved in cell wall biosynthesis